MRTAAEDIAQIPEITHAELLLISDGEDGSVANPDVVRSILAENTRFHAVLLGSHSEALEAAADTYRHFP